MLFYQPGLLYGGVVEHDCNTQRSVGYYLEALLMLAPFMKMPLKATLRGVTNDPTDPTVRAHASVRSLCNNFTCLFCSGTSYWTHWVELKHMCAEKYVNYVLWLTADAAPVQDLYVLGIGRRCGIEELVSTQCLLSFVLIIDGFLKLFRCRYVNFIQDLIHPPFKSWSEFNTEEWCWHESYVIFLLVVLKGWLQSYWLLL